ncbi:hypothetical protein [Campylobacter sp. RM9328]|uniref:hypothetical protein n=1 Tax=Campylobacter sp. RM9328 TaxID=1705720 RepID=UPI001475184E|nr:hypothetical protein [Campylobacter sp. RM9328]
MLLNNLLKENDLKLNNSLFLYNKKDVAIKILLFLILLALISNTFVESSFLFVENIKNIIYILLLISFGVYLFAEKIKKEKVVLISIIFILIYTVLYIESFFTQIELKLYIKPILIVPFLFFTFDSDKYNKQIFTILLIFLVFTFIYFEIQYINKMGFCFTNRFSSNSIDPNITGLYILFAFYLSRKINSKILMSIFLILGILTLSRNFILAILCLYALNYLKQIKSIYKLLKINFVTLLILLNIFLVSFSFFVKNINFTEVSSFTYSRITELFDESNYIRFKINRDAMEKLFASNKNFLFGLGSDYASNEKYDIKYKVHSGLLDFLTMYGFIYTLLFLLLLYYIAKNTLTYENLEYIYSYAVFSLFLPGTLGGWIYLILFIFILKLQELKYKKEIK